MRCISIKMPWATAILLGYKPVENRVWPTQYTGALLIHTGMSYDGDGARWIKSRFPSLYPEIMSHPITTARGCIVGQVDMVGCVTTLQSPWFVGPYGHVYQNPRIADNPVVWPGKLKLFNVPENIVQELFDGGENGKEEIETENPNVEGGQIIRLPPGDFTGERQ